MKATIENQGEVGQTAEVDDYGRIVVAQEYAGKEIEIAFEVKNDE